MVSKVENYIRDEAYLIRSVNYRDNDRVISCLTKTHGRVDLIAYGARKSQKRSLGVLDFLNLLSLEYHPNRKGGLNRLHQIHLIKGPGKINEDYEALNTALHWCRLLSKVLILGGAVPKIFTVFQEHLDTLNRNNVPWLDCNFRYRILSSLGYHLELSSCIQCQENRESPASFLASRGGMVCRKCAGEAGETGIGKEWLDDGLWELKSAGVGWNPGRLRWAGQILLESYGEFLDIFPLEKSGKKTIS